MTKTELNIHLSEELDRGFAYGEACFETFRVIGSEIFAWPQHAARLASGLAEFGIALSDEQLACICQQALRAAASSGADALVRITVSGGLATWGLGSASKGVDAYIQSRPCAPSEEPVQLQCVNWPFALQSRSAKFSSDYSNTLRAYQLWKNEGMEASIMPLICSDGTILSTMTANVMIYIDEKWYTPECESGGVLAGVIRNHLVTHAAVHEARCPQLWADQCEAMALTNSGFFVRPVSSIDGRELNVDHEAFELLYQPLRGEKGVAGL
ncbi:MAG: aminotransferase class IV [Mariprofundaceae bacterium]|nr:aminotransferase class IV [Mariprofundaceae bacterium]